MVSGVVTDGSAPLEGAIVMQAGGVPAFTTGPDGAFSIEITTAIPGTPSLVASKVGFRTRGVEFLELPVEPITLDLLAAKPPDNIAYKYGPPGTGEGNGGSTEFCDHCHTSFVAQFWTSAHSRSAKDPLLQDLYAGVTQAASDAAGCAALGGELRDGLVPGTAGDVAAKCYLGGGVLSDLNPGCGAAGQLACDDPALPAAQEPKSFGKCADCHAPGIDGKAGGRDLHEAVGLAFDAGNHCDVCHHVSDIDLTKPAGAGNALVIQRPREKLDGDPTGDLVQVMYGPLPDVPVEFMGGSYQPKFSTSELCAGCHLHRQEALLPGAALDPGRWPEGLPVHDTFSEWEGSAWNDPGTQCQFCHMPPDDTGLVSTVDVTYPESASIVNGFIRPSEQIRKHLFRGPLSGAPRLIDAAVNLGISAVQGAGPGGEPVVTATLFVQNLLAGHAIPTGEPMRSLLVVARADGCGEDWVATAGDTIFDGGGSLASGVAGADLTVNGAQITWPAGAALAKPAMRVRVVRATGTFDDYPGVGFFADPTLTPEEKGLPDFAPVIEATVLSAANGVVAVDAPISVQPGDLVYLGDGVPAALVDGEGARSFAGAPGKAFQKTLVDPSGARHVPHHRAIDVASDNRIAPQGSDTAEVTFAVPAGCTSGSITVTLLYRPVPVDMARLRGWQAKDWVIAKKVQTVTVM